MAHRRAERVLSPSGSPHRHKILAAGATGIAQGGTRPDAHRQGQTGQPAPVDPAIGSLLTDATGISLDLWEGLEYSQARFSDACRTYHA